MRKDRKEEEQCCAYRETLRAKKKKEARSAKKKPRNVTADCCSGKRLTCDELSKVTAESSTPLVCGGKIKKKKTKRIKKQDDSCPPDIDKLFPQIKPTISEREKYVNILHIMCVLEEEDLIRMKEIQKIREKLKEEEEKCEEVEIENQTDSNEKVEQTSSVTESVKSEATDEENQEKNSLTVGGKTSEQVRENRNAAKMKMAAGKSAKIECTSICSFDSVVDLTGLHLTKKDVEQIEKDREQLRKEQNSECESQNVEVEE